VATSGSRRKLLAPRRAAVETGDVSASGMVEIWRVNLQFVAARCGTVPFGANLRNRHLNACVNRRFGVLFVWSCSGEAPTSVATEQVRRVAGFCGWLARRRWTYRACLSNPENDTFIKIENAVKERKAHRNAADFDGKFIRETMLSE
jgi:hypothetical protein